MKKKKKNLSFNWKMAYLGLVLLMLSAAVAATILAANSASAQSAPLAPEQIGSLEKEAEEAGKIWNEESILRSISLYETAARKWKDQGSSSSRASFCFREAARAALLVNKKTEALSLLQEALALSGEKPEDRVSTLSLLSVAYLRAGDISASEKQADSARELLSSIDNGNYSNGTAGAGAKAAFFFALGQIAAEKNDHENAVKNYEQALNLWQKAGSSKEEAQTLYYLSFAYMGKEKAAAGLKKAEESLIKWREIADKRGETLSLVAIGQMYFKMDENQTALEFFQKAEPLFPPNTDQLERAVLYNSMASVYETFDLWDLALVYRQKAFDLYEAEKNPYAQLATYPSLGKASQKIGDRKIAEQYFIEGLKLSRQLKDKLFEAIIHQEMGNMYFEAGDDENAARFFNEALAGVTRQGYQRSIALIKGNLGKVSFRQGNLPVARKHFEEALSINRRIRNRFAEADILYRLAALDDREGETEAALQKIKDSLAVTESIYYGVDNQNLRTNYFSGAHDRYALYIKLLMKMDKQFPQDAHALEAFCISEKMRARSMFEVLQFSKAGIKRENLAPEILDREKEIRRVLNSKADKLTDLLSRDATPGEEVEQIGGEISQLEHEIEDLKAEIERKSPLYSELKNPPPFDIAGFQNRVLDDSSLLLEFSFGESESYLWLIGKNEVRYFILPPREEIESRIQNLRGLISAREARSNESIEDYQARVNKADASYTEESRILSRQLFGQIAGQMKEKRLLIVPDGKLHYFPVSALPFPGSNDDQPILLTNEVVTEPSASILNLFAKRDSEGSSPKPSGSKNLLVFSDAVFSTDDPRFKDLPDEGEKTLTSGDVPPSSGNLRFVESLASLPRLSASKDEAEVIASIVGNAAVFSGFAANRETFLNANVSDYRIIHLATHGLIDETRPELSGIVLSRFNERGDKVDEFIRLQDIYGLDFSADLVVLSACNTGVGKEIKGQGLKSLTNAFMQSGARTVVSSLWKVDDYATLELMKNFYAGLAGEKLTPSRALRQAQIRMWESRRYRSPFYWAAFSIQGNFQSPASISSVTVAQRNLLVLTAISAGILVLLLGIYLTCRFKVKKS